MTPTQRSGKQNKALKREANPLPFHLRQQQRRGRSRKTNLALVPDQTRTTRKIKENVEPRVESRTRRRAIAAARALAALRHPRERKRRGKPISFFPRNPSVRRPDR